MAVPRSDGGAVVDFIFHRFAYPVHERREAFEFRVVGGGRDGAIEGGPLDVGGWAETALAGGGSDFTFLRRSKADGDRDGRGAHALRV